MRDSVLHRALNDVTFTIYTKFSQVPGKMFSKVSNFLSHDYTDIDYPAIGAVVSHRKNVTCCEAHAYSSHDK